MVDPMAEIASRVLPMTLLVKPVMLPTRPLLLPGGGAYADAASLGRKEYEKLVDTVTGMLEGSACMGTCSVSKISPRL